MKVFKYSLSLLTFGVLFGGCSSTDEPAPLPDEEEEPVHGPAISSEAANETAAHAMDAFGYMSLSRAEEANVIIKTYSSVEEDTAFYVISYPEGGFVAVNADSWSPVSVLAISDRGDISSHGLAFLSATRPGGPIGPVQPITPQPAVDVTEYYYDTPDWGQRAPYWKYCLTPDGAQSTVGDVAVAMGEILAYYKQPIKVDGSQFDWSTADTDTDAVARLLHQIGVDMDADYDYICEISLKEILPAMRKYGFAKPYTTTLKNSNWEDMLSQGPVMVVGIPESGKSYAWVADGYRKTVMKDVVISDIDGNPSNVTLTNIYYRFNWGDEGSDNGLYWVYKSDMGTNTYWLRGSKKYDVGACTFYIPK